MNPIAQRIVEAIEWSSYEVSNGSAAGLGGVLSALLASSNFRQAAAAWEKVEDVVFSQGVIYSAAEPTVSVMIAALTEDQPRWRSGRILDLLFFIVSGVSLTDPGLQERCRNRAREGLWLLARWVLTHEGWDRNNALEVIEVVAPDRVAVIRSAIVS